MFVNVRSPGDNAGDDSDLSEGEGPLPIIPGAPSGRDRALKHGGHIAPMGQAGSDGIPVNPRKRGRGVHMERDMVRMRNENQRYGVFGGDG